MELEFKNSFVAGSAANKDSNSFGASKANQSNDGKTFESTLDSKKKEMKANEEKSPFTEVKETEKKEKPKEKKADKAKTDDTSVKANEKDAVESKKPEAAEKTVESAVNGMAEEIRSEVAEFAQEAANVVESVEPTEIPAEGLTDEQNVDVMKQIAEIMGVAPEQVANTLDKLQMEPEDLRTPENLTKFVMEIKEIKDPAELLIIPEMARNVKDIKNIVNEAAEQVKGAQNPQVAQPQAESAAKNQAPALTNEQAVKTETAMSAQAVQNVLPEGEKALEGNIAEDDAMLGEVATKAELADAKAQQAALNGQSKGGEQQAAGGNPNGKSTDTQIQTADEPVNNTPVVFQQGNETIVQVDGKTVSRTAERPQLTPQAQDVLNQIVDKMKIDFKPDSTEIKINLRPQDLGNVQVRIVTESGNVTAEIVAENSKVKELIEQNLSTLKESLKEQGVDVGELSVSVGQQEAGESMQQFMKEQEKTQGRMSQILRRINGEDLDMAEPASYSDKPSVMGSSVEFSA